MVVNTMSQDGVTIGGSQELHLGWGKEGLGGHGKVLDMGGGYKDICLIKIH